jgi:hypothetical protein
MNTTQRIYSVTFTVIGPASSEQEAEESAFDLVRAHDAGQNADIIVTMTSEFPANTLFDKRPKASLDEVIRARGSTR